MTDSIALYMHAGSGNHGCEAIADSLLLQLGEEGAPAPVTLMTNSAAEDGTYRLKEKENVRIVEENHIDAHPIIHTLCYGYRALSGRGESFQKYRFRAITGKNAPRLAVSIGGDNYCYPDMLRDMFLADSVLRKQGTKTMLLGCSIEPSFLTGEGKNEELIKDLSGFSRITARESLTYEALKKAGFSEEQLLLLPDPAFAMPREPKVVLPEGFRMTLPVIAKENGPMEKTPGTTGINISPMAGDFAADRSVYMSAVRGLIRHILNTGEDRVLLIPHVVWKNSDDRGVLKELKDSFSAKDSERILTAGDMSAEELKGIIAHCARFVGSRTHATIAAYSSGVPTLVLGYSVKARGIAEDLFGTDEHYVLPVQTLTEEAQLIEAYEWLLENEDSIRARLRSVMPDYIERAGRNGRAIMSVYGEI